MSKSRKKSQNVNKKVTFQRISGSLSCNMFYMDAIQKSCICVNMADVGNREYEFQPFQQRYQRGLPQGSNEIQIAGSTIPPVTLKTEEGQYHHEGLKKNT